MTLDLPDIPQFTVRVDMEDDEVNQIITSFFEAVVQCLGLSQRYLQHFAERGYYNLHHSDVTGYQWPSDNRFIYLKIGRTIVASVLQVRTDANLTESYFHLELSDEAVCRRVLREAEPYEKEDHSLSHS